MAYLKEKKKKESTETVPENALLDLVADSLDKNFKTPVLKTLKELKEDVQKVKKTMCVFGGREEISMKR